MLDCHTIVSPLSSYRHIFVFSFRKYYMKKNFFLFYWHPKFTEDQTFKSQDTNKNLLENLLYTIGVICQETYLVNMKSQNDQELAFFEFTYVKENTKFL